jgi:hypothetical protein
MKVLHMALLASCVLAPSLVARRGIGAPWIWSGGGFTAFVAMCVYSIAWSQGLSEFERTLDPPPLPLGGADVYCFALAFGLMLAGLLYKPKKEVSTSLLGNHEGGITDARRTNGKDEGD